MSGGNRRSDSNSTPSLLLGHRIKGLGPFVRCALHSTSARCSGHNLNDTCGGQPEGASAFYHCRTSFESSAQLCAMEGLVA